MLRAVKAGVISLPQDDGAGTWQHRYRELTAPERHALGFLRSPVDTRRLIVRDEPPCIWFRRGKALLSREGERVLEIWNETAKKKDD